MRSLAVATTALTLATLATPAGAQSMTQAEAAALRLEVDRINDRLVEIQKLLAAQEVVQTPASEAAPPPASPPPASPLPVQQTISDAPPPWSLADSGRPPPVRGIATTVDRALQTQGLIGQISASSGGGEVGLRYTSTMSRSRGDGRSGPRFSGTGQTDRWTVAASAPINKDDATTDISRIGDLTSGVELTVGWNRFSRRIFAPPANANDSIALAARAACTTKARAAKDEAQRLRVAATYEAAVAQAITAVSAADVAIAACATDAMDGTFIRTHLNAEAETEWLSPLFGSAQVVGFEVTAGYADHRFLDEPSLSMKTESHAPWGVKGFYSFLPDNDLSSVTASVAYQSAFDDGDTTVICPVGPAPSVRCLSGALGAPESERRLLTALELRHQHVTPPGSLFPSISVSAEFTYDHLNDEFGFDLPVYLVADDKGGLIGGVRLSYGTEDDEWIAGVFVGAPFSLWK